MCVKHIPTLQRTHAPIFRAAKLNCPSLLALDLISDAQDNAGIFNDISNSLRMSPKLQFLSLEVLANTTPHNTLTLPFGEDHDDEDDRVLLHEAMQRMGAHATSPSSSSLAWASSSSAPKLKNMKDKGLRWLLLNQCETVSKVVVTKRLTDTERQELIKQVEQHKRRRGEDDDDGDSDTVEKDEHDDEMDDDDEPDDQLDPKRKGKSKKMKSSKGEDEEEENVEMAPAPAAATSTTSSSSTLESQPPAATTTAALPGDVGATAANSAQQMATTTQSSVASSAPSTATIGFTLPAPTTSSSATTTSAVSTGTSSITLSSVPLRPQPGHFNFMSNTLISGAPTMKRKSSTSRSSSTMGFRKVPSKGRWPRAPHSKRGWSGDSDDDAYDSSDDDEAGNNNSATTTTTTTTTPASAASCTGSNGLPLILPLEGLDIQQCRVKYSSLTSFALMPWLKTLNIGRAYGISAMYLSSPAKMFDPHRQLPVYTKTGMIYTGPLVEPTTPSSSSSSVSVDVPQNDDKMNTDSDGDSDDHTYVTIGYKQIRVPKEGKQKKTQDRDPALRLKKRLEQYRGGLWLPALETLLCEGQSSLEVLLFHEDACPALHTLVLDKCAVQCIDVLGDDGSAATQDTSDAMSTNVSSFTRTMKDLYIQPDVALSRCRLPRASVSNCSLWLPPSGRSSANGESCLAFSMERMNRYDGSVDDQGDDDGDDVDGNVASSLLVLPTPASMKKKKKKIKPQNKKTPMATHEVRQQNCLRFVTGLDIKKLVLGMAGDDAFISLLCPNMPNLQRLYVFKNKMLHELHVASKSLEAFELRMCEALTDVFFDDTPNLKLCSLVESESLLRLCAANADSLAELTAALRWPSSSSSNDNSYLMTLRNNNNNKQSPKTLQLEMVNLRCGSAMTHLRLSSCSQRALSLKLQASALQELVLDRANISAAQLNTLLALVAASLHSLRLQKNKKLSSCSASLPMLRSLQVSDCPHLHELALHVRAHTVHLM